MGKLMSILFGVVSSLARKAIDQTGMFGTRGLDQPETVQA